MNVLKGEYWIFLEKYRTGGVPSDEILDELNANANDNTWINYFLNCASYIGENWIDFESEISKVIQSLDEARVRVGKGISVLEIQGEKGDILADICKASRWTVIDALKDIRAIDSFANFLNSELDKLIRALEIYIAEFVNKIAVIKNNVDIEKISVDRVLSFNYSNTYERVYGAKRPIEYDYIHGKADINKNILTSDLVLGIDEYLNDKKKNRELEFLTFKKFYQRMYKGTENVYLEWADEIKDKDVVNQDLVEAGMNYSEHTLYIFGHSLDITDKDILKIFVCNDNVQTKIFYFRKDSNDKKELGKLIRNLIRIMGQDELIRRTGGSHKTIEFVPQALEN